ncbi:MAG: nucleotide pyrophosphohydrolase [Candidatus Pacebacteria bacterium]|nr:nucleotide pyrophosphohydrolase [Candidatus Paceibacterota bacterium]
MKEFEKEIDAYLIERDWKNRTTPDYLAKSISIEAAELLEIFQRKGWTREEILADEKILENVKDELGDIMILATQLAMKIDGNLLDFARAKLEKAKKKYPAELVRGDNTDNYYAIKQQYRSEK